MSRETSQHSSLTIPNVRVGKQPPTSHDLRRNDRRYASNHSWRDGVNGRNLKADAVRAGLPLYRVAAEARINPSQLSRLLNDRAVLEPAMEARIRGALERLSEQAT